MSKPSNNSESSKDNSEDNKVVKLLADLGVSYKSGNRVKFGGGISGRIATVAISGIAGMSSIALYLAHTAWYASAGLGIFAFITVIYAIEKINNFARDHPDTATLEGLEMIMYREQELQLTSKDLAAPILITKLEAATQQPASEGSEALLESVTEHQE